MLSFQLKERVPVCLEKNRGTKGQKGGIPMNKYSNLIAGLTVLVFSLLSVSAYAGETMPMSRDWDRSQKVGEITGKIVRNPQGEYLGTIGDVVFDSEGHVSLVALSQYPTWGLGMAWRMLAIPFDALNYDADKGYFVLNTSRERLASAPDFQKENLSNQEWVTGVYQYYGVQPYWTEMGSTGYMGNPIERWMDEHHSDK